MSRRAARYNAARLSMWQAVEVGDVVELYGRLVRVEDVPDDRVYGCFRVEDVGPLPRWWHRFTRRKGTR